MSNQTSNGATDQGSAPQSCPLNRDDQIGRDHHRTGSLLLTDVRVGGAPSRLVTVRNVSSLGLMGDMDEPPHVGQVVEFKLGSLGWLGASVVWTVAHRFGVRFHQEIDPTGLCCAAIG
jgi:hypothetical protein